MRALEKEVRAKHACLPAKQSSCLFSSFPISTAISFFLINRTTLPHHGFPELELHFPDSLAAKWVIEASGVGRTCKSKCKGGGRDISLEERRWDFYPYPLLAG